MTSWRNPPPIPSWRDFARGAWQAIWQIDKCTQLLERIEGHLVVLNEHAESATLARRRAVDVRKDIDASRLSAMIERSVDVKGVSAFFGKVRLIVPLFNFEEVIDVAVPRAGSCSVTSKALEPPLSNGDTSHAFVYLQGLPHSVSIAEVTFGASCVFCGEARMVRFTHSLAVAGFVTVELVHRPPLKESTNEPATR